ncbi:MAG: hypothetical protein SAL07_10420 [Oscillatoria sp. PMC 1051.18]|uniref:hypothetical protein n=1 Tax=Oscillatoria salina TaxID=331517 RepID=UPI0013BD1A5E|nr:hypothetical protein [Oscillatoria salina]MBZ8181798.1 hypothetical protein [Oscillatoria salina IIICB1]MEC4895347.1 hypothetical protein [Oscillatoria sp. PMC 1050.18]MEC5030317.1 hypothetical protein [Oscillatoria sp. PMC 1051.18]NET89426.1 hypothetical protein [Kamptonema sp. SIO1D9]
MRPYLPRYSILFILSAAISFANFGCADPKLSQCKKIIDIANDVATETQNLSDSGSNTDPQAALQVASAFEQAAQAMETLESKDEQLLDYQAGLIQVYHSHSQATRQFVEAYEKKNRGAAEAALKTVREAGNLEQEVVNGINNYCNVN